MGKRKGGKRVVQTEDYEKNSNSYFSSTSNVLLSQKKKRYAEKMNIQLNKTERGI